MPATSGGAPTWRGTHRIHNWKQVLSRRIASRRKVDMRKALEARSDVERVAVSNADGRPTTAWRPSLQRAGGGYEALETIAGIEKDVS